VLHGFLVMAEKRNWKRDEIILALGLYAVTPSAKINSSNKAIQELAKLLGRSTGAVSYKLSNLLELDKHRQNGPKGFGNFSKADEEVMREFSVKGDVGNLKLDLLHETVRKICDYQFSRFPIEFDHQLLRNAFALEEKREGNEISRLVTVRSNQEYFRSSVLANCGSRCAITQCQVSSLLEAAHILPWASSEETRMEISNGLPLIPLFHKAYDQNLIGISPDGLVKVSKKLLQSGDELFRSFMAEVEDKKLYMEGYKTPVNRDYLSQRFQEFVSLNKS
jgi:putative restriction endonuclease